MLASLCTAASEVVFRQTFRDFLRISDHSEIIGNVFGLDWLHPTEPQQIKRLYFSAAGIIFLAELHATERFYP